MKIKLTGYKRAVIVCKKCGKSVSVETDFLTEEQAKKLHTCKVKGK